MRIPTARTFAVLATATMLLGGVTASARAGDTGPSIAKQVTSVIWCRQTNGLMRQVWTKTDCKAGESKYVLKAAAGPRGPQGPTGPKGAAGVQGATGAAGAQGANGTAGLVGATGATGAQGPSDLYPGTLAQQMDVGDIVSTFATVTVPAGSYLVQFSNYAYASTAAQTLVCAVFSSAGPPLSLPAMNASLTASLTTQVPMSATGWYAAAGDTTLALRCVVSVAGQSATLSNLHFSALKVGTIH